MKKILILILMLFVALLVGCGDSDVEEPIEGIEEPAEDVAAEEPVEDNNSGIYFKDNEVQTEDVKIKITETKVIQPGEEGNDIGEKPVFAIWYETTNLSDKEIDPIDAWIAIFTAIQDNDPNAINKLEVGMLPDDAHLDSQMEKIKKDGTVENSTSYELDDLETPVTLVANQGIGGDEIGRQDYEISE